MAVAGERHDVVNPLYSEEEAQGFREDEERDTETEYFRGKGVKGGRLRVTEGLPAEVYRQSGVTPPSDHQQGSSCRSVLALTEEPTGSPVHILQPEDRHYKSRSDSGAEKVPVCSQWLSEWQMRDVQGHSLPTNRNGSFITLGTVLLSH